jgi:hypothetical protein
MTSIRNAVGQALADRLKTITTAVGWPREIKNVWYDDIPLGLELMEHHCPALFVLDDGGSFRHQQQVVDVARNFRIQIVMPKETVDSEMDLLIRLIVKAIFANSPTAEVTGEFRVHPIVYQITLQGDDVDHHVIEANRIASIRFIVHYRTKPYDL